MTIALALMAAGAPLACGAVSRPGIADHGEDGIWRGRAVEACRAVATAIAGEGAKIAFHGYDTLAALRAAARDRIAFVSAEEGAAASLATTGPAVAVERQLLVVMPSSAARAPGDLDGRMVCFIIGTRAEDALDRLAARGVAVERLGFQEPDEMADGLTAGRCAALAVDANDGIGAEHRVLSPPLVETPIVAATPAGDPAWTRRVAAILAERR